MSATSEYIATLVCREGARCSSDDDVREHQLPSGPFASPERALLHADTQRQRVYGMEHDVKILTRTVSDWEELP